MNVLINNSLAEEHSTTGNEKTEVLINYTKLNDRRMKRWDKTVKISELSKKRINGFTLPVTWLVIVESWCADAAHVLPVLNKMAHDLAKQQVMLIGLRQCMVR